LNLERDDQPAIQVGFTQLGST